MAKYYNTKMFQNILKNIQKSLKKYLWVSLTSNSLEYWNHLILFYILRFKKLPDGVFVEERDVSICMANGKHWGL